MGAADVLDEVGVDVEGALFAAGVECFLENGSHEVNDLDFLGLLAGFACAVCCWAAPCGAIRPAWHPIP